jgi:hypothetical protein
VTSLLPFSLAMRVNSNYYEKITKDITGKVLAKHGVVERHADQYRLTI